MGTEAGTTDTEPAIGEADYHCSVKVSTKFRGRFNNIWKMCLLLPPTGAVHLPLVKIGTFVHKDLFERLLVREVWSPVTLNISFWTSKSQFQVVSLISPY